MRVREHASTKVILSPDWGEATGNTVAEKKNNPK
jgi:hypothetical protein